MKYLITGVSGQLGYDVKRDLLERGVSENDISSPRTAEMDITERQAV